MEELKKWLDDPARDYFKGVQLYARYGTDVRLKQRVFPAGPHANNQKLLHYELGKEFERMSAAPMPLLTSEAPKEQEVPQNEILPETTPQEPTEGIQVPIPETTQGYLRKEFPQIKFDTLPDELKVLIVDRIALFHKAKDAREKKFEATTDEDRLKWNSIEIESRIENQQIWDELNHYQQTGGILGKHPRFERMKAIEKLQALSREQLFKRKQNFPSAISKAKTAIREAGDDEELIIKKQALLDKYAWQEKEVDRLLGL